MVGGQVMDIQAENQEITLAHLQHIHSCKTGRLIRAAVRIGGILGSATSQQLQCLTEYSEDIGLAFQIADDVLNMVGSREELGKEAGTDEKRGKKTYPSFFGVEGARQMGEDCIQRAIKRLEIFNEQAVATFSKVYYGPPLLNLPLISHFLMGKLFTLFPSYLV